MIKEVIATLIFISFSAVAQEPPAPMPAPETAAVPTPAPAPEMAAPPPPGNPPAMPGQAPEPAPANPPPNAEVPPSPPPAPALAPIENSPDLPSLANPPGAKKTPAKDPSKMTLKEIEMNAVNRNKSPFMIPTELYLKIKRRLGEKVVENVIDDSVSPKVRWPLRSYQLMGVYSGVKVPKALIQDKDQKTHVFRLKELIGNSGGYISEIGNGEVIVVERGSEVKMSLKKDMKN